MKIFTILECGVDWESSKIKTGLDPRFRGDDKTGSFIMQKNYE